MLLEQVDQGGTIDPSCFVDEDGSRVLIYKNDGNSMGKECWLYMRRLEADGVTLVGEEVSTVLTTSCPVQLLWSAVRTVTRL